MYIDHNIHVALWLTMMEGPHSLTLHWRSLSRFGREHGRFTSSYNGSRYFVYDNLQSVTSQITHDTWPTIVDTPATFFFKMGPSRYRHLFCQWRQQIIPLLLSALCRWCDCPGHMTQHPQDSVDARCQDEVWSESLSFLALTAAKTSIINNLNTMDFVLLDIFDHKLLMCH
jgi:hypothetical protein